MLETRLLRYFVTVAETLHFGRAAEELHLAPQPLSQAIRRLEDQLGVLLFERTSRRVALTPAGEAFHTRAKALLAQLADAIETAQMISAGELGALSVGYTTSVLHGVLPELVQRFEAAFPGVRLCLKELCAADVPGAFASGDVEVVVGVGVPLGGHFATRRIGRDRVVAVVQKHHDLAERVAVTPTELARYPIIGYDANTRPELAAFLDEVLPRGVRQHEVRQEVTTELAAVSLAHAGLGVALVTASITAMLSHDVAVLPLRPEVPVEYVVLWDEARVSPALQRFLTLLHAPPLVDELVGTARV